MRFRTPLLTVFACLVCTLSAWADPAVTIANKPFPGVVEVAGNDTFVELLPFAKALDLRADPVLGGWYVFKGDRDPAGENRNVTSADQVWANGHRCDAHKTDGHYMVSLHDITHAFNIPVDTDGDQYNVKP